MKVTYPLSFKVSVWLLLNLLLLAAATVGFFIVQGGLSWDALLAGPAGEHAQAKANVIASEVAAEPVENRSAVLARFAEANKAEFFLIRGDESRIAGPNTDLPPIVRARTDFFRPLRKGGPPRGGEFPPMGEVRRSPPAEVDAARRAPPREPDTPRGESGTARVETGATRGESPAATRGDSTAIARIDAFFDPSRELLRGRFIVRTDAPTAYWIGVRVPFITQERARFRGPTMLVARVDSLWSLLRFLNLQSWLLAGTGVLALSVVFWLPLVHSITRSLGQLTHVTERIAEGRFDTRVVIQRRDELGNLGESVNRMASRLDAHMTGQKRFLGDVAHELCSPLARLQMATGILADQAPTTLKETVADVREEVQQMSTLVNELLAFTKSGLKPREAVCSPVELEPLAREVLAREDPAGRTVLAIAPELRVRAERDLLGRALGNLVRNAVRYAGDAGAITVGATREGQNVFIRVDDEGPGVPAPDIDRLGEPFFRPELARTRESGGVGLGLAIVRNSIAGCGGEVRFSNRTPHGLRAEIRLGAA
jgi:two-component system, OmpR family, sensor histidine kinase CpxA